MLRIFETLDHYVSKQGLYRRHTDLFRNRLTTLCTNVEGLGFYIVCFLVVSIATSRS